MKDLEKILKAFANRRRLAIVKYLKKNGEAPVSKIAGEIKLSFKATSKHLGILTAADILEESKEACICIIKFRPILNRSQNK